jgi:tetratricopeptide (TPR) repeat protein
MKLTMSKLLFLFILTLSQQVLASPADDALLELQHDWAVANYDQKGDAQVAAFERLVEKSQQATSAYPDAAGIWIWDGIIRSSFAGVRGGLGALSLAKESRASLEKAMELDANALDGSAYTSLGTLYFKVPGWPVGFGSDKKAASLLEQALAINPDGIDPNYFYADYLISKKDYDEAERFLLKAQQATPRAGRERADAGRQAEISDALASVREKLGRASS